MTHSYIELEHMVERWAQDRKIIPNSNSLAQARKTHEESGELLEAAAKMHYAIEIGDFDGYSMVLNEYRDAIGDVLVTMIIGAALAEVSITECLQQAYDAIKDRKGHLNADGIFVKEAA